MPEPASVQSFLARTERSFGERLVAWILLPFAFLYWISITARKALYGTGLFKQVRLPAKVISVGGITIGGSGKTPAVIHLAKYLESIGKKTLILTRGYGGETQTSVVVRPGDDTMKGSLSDEVRLISEKVSVTIGVGADRVAAFWKASDSKEFDAVILDDGFQHFKITRDLDIVVLDATAPFGNSYLLPSGNLREPKASLRRADLIVLTRISQCENAVRVGERLANDFENKTIVLADYVPDGIRQVHTGEIVDSGIFSDRSIFAFSAIANPDSFFSILESEGLEIVGKRAFRDHHIFTQTDIEELVREARTAECSAFVVTEKDAVKLKALDCGRIPIYAFRIRLQISEGEDSLRNTIMKVLDDKA
jgi:tetraacyldisaccharide 4'-kinase